MNIEQIRADSQRMVRQFCSGLFDQSQGNQEEFERAVQVFARQVVIEIHALIPSEKSDKAFDIYKSL